MLTKQISSYEVRLLTPYVYIDTSALWHHNFLWNGQVLSKIREFVDIGFIRIKTTDILMREIESNLREKVSVAVETLAKARKTVSILRRWPDNPVEQIFSDIDYELAVHKLLEGRDEFFRECAAESIDVLGSVGRVLDAYFGKQAPFGNEKKKSEFPDAFVAMSLMAWCEQENSKIYVVSKDGDLKSCCSDCGPLLHVSSLEELITIATVEARVLDALKIWLMDAYEIQEKVEREFPNRWCIIEDQNGDVVGMEVTDVNVLDIFVIEKNGNSFSVDMPVDVTFEADIRYDDMATATYDSEDKVLMPWRKINETVKRTQRASISVECYYDPSDRDAREIYKISLIEPKTIYMRVAEPERRR